MYWPKNRTLHSNEKQSHKHGAGAPGEAFITMASSGLSRTECLPEIPPGDEKPFAKSLFNVSGLLPEAGRASRARDGQS